ncbi:DUF4185 domain-containing protein [Dietzia sp. CQ4]|uniref:DUF4185 domain-containing protein n=1 Tax=Dietzia sp. (strain CQ4) TaxID=370437 RepID=UPI0015FE1365|nr:DUF4185 domain-containing protein [Dietzia sp. CQ4]MBB1033172.1 DUF4185 domain-containing protein [Dietzia sp. CQ4]
MARLVKELTGPNETGRWGAAATDLGYPAVTNHGYTITIFGDTFVDRVGGADWRSPVGFRQSNPDIENGIRWDNAIGGAHAKQMINYQHRGTVSAGQLPDGFTNIPNDLIHLPDGRYIMTTFAIRSWDPITAGGSWATFHSRLWTSTDAHAENWGRTRDLEANRENFDFPNTGEWSHFQNNTMLMFPGEPWVYIYGTNEGRWNGGGIHLMRVDWRSMWNRSTYEFWGRDGGGVWAWRRGGFTTPILTPTLPNNAIGELSAQVINGRVVLSYCDGVLGAITRTSPRPEGVWTLPAIQVTAAQQPALYAPAIHPYSSLGRAQMLLSAWPQVNGQTLYYGTRQWEVSLTGGGSGSLSSSSAARASTEQLSPESSLVTEEYTGDLAPDLSALDVSEQVAVLDDATESDVDRNWLRAALQGEVEDDRTTPAGQEVYGPMTSE